MKNKFCQSFISTNGFRFDHVNPRNDMIKWIVTENSLLKNELTCGPGGPGGPIEPVKPIGPGGPAK